MLKRNAGRLAFFLFFFAVLAAAETIGRVVDPTGAGVGGAQVALTNLTGIVARTASAANGAFRFDLVPSPDDALVVTAPGFATRTVPLDQAATIQLELAPRVDTVQVVGSTIDMPAASQASSVDVIAPEQVRQRNEPFAMDLLRYIPGVTFNQSGSFGGVSSLFLRGGNANMNLVRMDGVPVVGFGGGLGFDFAHIPAEAVDHIEMIRGAQSAVYGPYANTGVIDFVTRQPGSSPRLDLLAEGGSHNERRFGITGSGTVAGFGLLASASRFDTDGMVANDDYRNEDVLLNLSRVFRRQRVSLHGFFDSNEVGQPGPWGSDPKHTFPGIDTISRGKNNFSEYGAHYEADLGPRVRQEFFGSFFLYNNGFRSPYGFSFNKDHARTRRGAHSGSRVAARYRVLRRDRGPGGGEEHLHHRCELQHLSDRPQ